jgi:hypothetical protein
MGLRKIQAIKRHDDNRAAAQREAVWLRWLQCWLLRGARALWHHPSR